MDENDFESIAAEALKAFGAENDLPIEVDTVREKKFGTEAGLIVKVGGVEFHLAITQTVFEEA